MSDKLSLRARLSSLWKFAIGDESALYNLYPELARRVHVSSSSSGDAPAAGLFYDEAVTDYATHVWLQRAVRIWAESLSPLRLQVVDAGGGVIDNHPLVWLLDNPNPQMDGSDLWRWWATDMALGGECGWEIAAAPDKKTTWLFHRSPSQFDVTPDESQPGYGFISGYTIKPSDARAKPYDLPPEEFLHFKFVNPQAPYRGLPPHQAVMLGVDIDQLITSSTHQYFANPRRPDFGVIAPNGITSTERDEILFEMGVTSNVNNPHRPVVLEQGVTDIKQLGFPRKDTEWLPQKQLTREEVGAAYGIPSEMLSSVPRAYENLDASGRLLWELTLTPLCGFRDRQLTRFFRRAGLLESGLAVSTDTSEIWALRRAKSVQFADVRALWGMGVPFNVLDVVYKLGIGPIPGGEFPHGAAPVEVDEAQGEQSVRDIQRAELDALRRLRANRVLGRGRGATDAGAVGAAIVEVASDDGDLADQLQLGEAGGESSLALQDRVIALYSMRKGRR